MRSPLGRTLLLLLWLLTLLPAPASGAESVHLSVYRAWLQAGVIHLERADQLIKSGKIPEAIREIETARPLLSGIWMVETSHGTMRADLTDLEALLLQAAADRLPQRYLPQALSLAREHLKGAEALEDVKMIDLPGARQTLDQALQQPSARSILQRISDWVRERLGWEIDLSEADGSTSSSALKIVAGIGLAALIWMGISLYRSLSGHRAPGEATLKQGRSRQLDRPPTPIELLALARGLSQRGEHLEALRRAHLALLRHYDGLRLIRYVPAQTNREHELQLRRRHPNLAQRLHLLNDLVDDRLYSGHGATVEDFLRVESLVEQLWREGDAASKGAEPIHGPSLSV